MFVIIEHEITKPESFWEMVKKADLPSHMKLHQSLPNAEGNKAVCLWEADSVDDVKEYVEGGVGDFSNNTYFAVKAENALGLPAR